MNKILLALAILGAGGGAFLTTRQSTARLEREAHVTREAWQAQSQSLAVTRNEQVALAERVVELNQALAQAPAAPPNVLWSALQTTRSGPLTSELREQALQELGFHWKSSDDFIVISKETLREYLINDSTMSIRDGKLTELAATVFAMTPKVRAQVEAVMERDLADFKDWVLAHAERGEPKDDVVAQYTLPNDETMSQRISNNFKTALSGVLGSERTGLILPITGDWMWQIGITSLPQTLMITRYLARDEPRLKVQIERQYSNSRSQSGGDLWIGPQGASVKFPEAFLPVFPNGWTDVAQREGFELPPPPEKQ